MSSIKEIESQLHVAEAAKIKVSWLQDHSEAIRKSYEAEKKATMLMELQTITILVERAARSDLKERHAKLVAAQNEFAEAERCVEVLKLVKKKLNNDVLESKAEKELLARKPIHCSMDDVKSVLQAFGTMLKEKFYVYFLSRIGGITLLCIDKDPNSIVQLTISRAVRMDLKSTKERFEKAQRCVKVLDQVEKKLHDNFMESKASKDSWAKQPIVLAN
nr:phospholipase-like protein [Tanacetum cinerariifolium]